MSGFLVAGADIVARVGEVVAARLASGLFQSRIVSMADVQARSQADGAPFERSIDGVPGAGDSSLSLDNGSISYRFLRLGPAVDFALAKAQELSPDPGGQYSRAWFVMVAGAPWTEPTSTLRANAVAYVINYVPYARRIEQGWHKARSQHHRPGLFITETVRQAVLNAFPYVQAEREFQPLSTAPMGTNTQVPWVLKRGQHQGEPILYPCVALSLKGA